MSLGIAQSLLGAATGYGVGLVILGCCAGAWYRLKLSPIASIPGPRLAALTFWYEFWYDAVLGGQYTFHIQKLHDRYGPIIRINPYEVHISDPAFIDTLYTSTASGEKRDKWHWYTKQFGQPTAAIATESHDHHRIRRAALNRFFSTGSVRRLQSLLDERVRRLLCRIDEAKYSGESIPLEYAFAAFTSDVVMDYTCGESENLLDRDDWGPEFHDAIIEGGKAGLLVKHMGWIISFLNSLPFWLQSALSPGLKLTLQFNNRLGIIIADIKEQSKVANSSREYPTLFHELLFNSNLPEAEKSVLRLKQEASIVVSAGTVTTSWALSVATFYLLKNPEVLEKLKLELENATPDSNEEIPPGQLESLPYLRAVIQEALRLSYGVSSRLQRISPDKPLIYVDPCGRSWVLAPGTPVSMTSVLIHHDESIFPNSHAFRPERWLENPELMRYLLAFSKGSRHCLGINLAYAELQLVLSQIFRRYGSAAIAAAGTRGVRHDSDQGFLELVHTHEREAKIAADGFVPLRDRTSRGIHVHVRS